MEIYREQCVMEGKLLGKLSTSHESINRALQKFNTSWCAYIDAEEAQTKIEELKDQEYSERRSAILTQNDIEMNELHEQKKEHIRAFEQNWNTHEKNIDASS